MTPNPSAQDEIRIVIWYIGHKSLRQTYDEHAKIMWAFARLKKTFPNNDKELYKLIDCLNDKDTEFLKEAWRFEHGSMDENKWPLNGSLPIK
jgi:hypothetical protein